MLYRENTLFKKCIELIRNVKSVQWKLGFFFFLTKKKQGIFEVLYWTLYEMFKKHLYMYIIIYRIVMVYA